MSPRTGRPPIENPKSKRITIRLNEYHLNVLNECSKKIGISNADIVCRGIDLMEVEKSNSKARQLLDGIVLLNDLVQKNSDLVEKQIRQVEANFRWYIDSIQK